jgi:hypothetical protein
MEDWNSGIMGNQNAMKKITDVKAGDCFASLAMTTLIEMPLCHCEELSRRSNLVSNGIRRCCERFWFL